MIAMATESKEPKFAERAEMEEKTKYIERATALEKTKNNERATVLEESVKYERANVSEKPISLERANVEEATIVPERYYRKPRKGSGGLPGLIIPTTTTEKPCQVVYHSATQYVVVRPEKYLDVV